MNYMLQKRKKKYAWDFRDLPGSKSHLGDFCIGVMQISGRALEGSKDIHGFLDEEVTFKKCRLQTFSVYDDNLKHKQTRMSGLEQIPGDHRNTECKG